MKPTAGHLFHIIWKIRAPLLYRLISIFDSYSSSFLDYLTIIWLYTIYQAYQPLLLTYRSFATTTSQLKICDFSGKTFRGF